MKIVKFILGLVGALTLIAGGFAAGTFITQTRTASAPVQRFAQPTFIQQQIQPTIVPQQQIQPLVVSQQPQVTPIPQTTLPAIPSQGEWGPGWWMMDPNYAPQGEWEHGWMMDPNFNMQGQQGWEMHDEDYNNRDGMHDGMMGGYNWQTSPNGNSAPNATPITPSYPTPSVSVSFKDGVQPIFAARCVACHGGTNGLYLNKYENILKGSTNGAVVIPGNVYNSRLAYYVYTGFMPFRSTPLSSVEVQTILDWIAAGAPNN